MPEHGGALDAYVLKGLIKEVGLCISRPNRAARPLAVSEPWAVENDNAVGSGRHVDETARLEILDQAAVAVQQDKWFAFAPLHVVQTDAIDFEELASRRVLTLRLVREMTV